MSLPKIKLPIHSLILPSTGEKVLFTPFTVKEEKLLLLAADDDEEVQIRTLRQILNNCILPNEAGKKINVEKLPLFDLDYLWLKIRRWSVEEIVTVPFECRQPLPEGQILTDSEGNKRNYCGQIVNVPINLDKVEVTKDPTNDPKISLLEGITVVLCYPTIETLQHLLKVKNENDIEGNISVVAECITLIYDSTDNKTYEKQHLEKTEVIEFLESLPQLEFVKIMKFFETLPKIKVEVKFHCPRCKHEANIVIEGTKSFLASASATKPFQT